MTPVGLITLATFLDTMSLDSAATARDPARRTTVAQQPAQGVPAHQLRAAAPVATAPAALLPPGFAEAAVAASQPTLSGLSQLISRIAAGASESAPLPAAVLPALTAETDALPEAIRNAVQASGLFYESHLEDWVAGRRTLEQLRLEPQGAVPVRAAPGDAAPTLRAAPDARVTAEALPAQAPADAEEAAPATHRAAPAGWHLPATLEPVVREQLAALAQGSASVPIVPWPGQQALLTVHEEPQPDARPREDADAEPAGGRLGLKLTLPRLGAVTFLVSAQGERIRVDARVAQPGSGHALEARAAELHEALAVRALSLDALKVEAGDA